MKEIKVLGEQKPLTDEEIRMAKDEAVKLYFNEPKVVVIEVEMVDSDPPIYQPVCQWGTCEKFATGLNGNLPACDEHLER